MTDGGCVACCRGGEGEGSLWSALIRAGGWAAFVHHFVPLLVAWLDFAPTAHMRRHDPGDPRGHLVLASLSLSPSPFLIIIIIILRPTFLRDYYHHQSSSLSSYFAILFFVITILVIVVHRRSSSSPDTLIIRRMIFMFGTNVKNTSESF